MLRSFLAAATLALTFASPARAIYLSRSGPNATLTGTFGAGDDAAFARFLAEGPIKVLYLNSFGGSIPPAVNIARMVRKAAITTAVEAQSATCDSACTLVFAGGARRHYIHGETVIEGFNAQSGLGFHPAHLKGDRVRFNIKSDVASDTMAKLYAEMGQPQAAALAARAGINSVYRPSGATSLRLHIATSLAAP